MQLTVLNIIKTHQIGPQPDGPIMPCKMRIAQNPNGGWYCVDCGRYILWDFIEVTPVEEKPEEPMALFRADFEDDTPFALIKAKSYAEAAEEATKQHPTKVIKISLAKQGC